MPDMTDAATKCIACCDDPHCRSTDVAGVVHGSPPATTALRPTLHPCSPDCVTQPVTTSSIRSGSTPVRSTRFLSVKPSRSDGCQPDERALAFAERGADDVDDDCFANFHDVSLDLHQVGVLVAGHELDGLADPLARLELGEQIRVFDLAVRTRAVTDVADDEAPLGRAVAAVGDGVARDVDRTGVACR